MSMFSNAKTIAPKKSAKADKATIQMDGVQDLAALNFLIDTLTTLKNSVAADVKSAAEIEFTKLGVEKKARPENFKATDGKGTVSCELRKRSTASALSASEVAALTEAGISMTTTENVVSTFVINPAYKDNQDLLGKIEKKLSTIKDLPADFILKQEGVSKTVVGDTAIDEVFTKDPAVVRSLLSIVSVMALKPTLGTQDINEAFAMVKHMVDFAEAA